MLYTKEMIAEKITTEQAWTERAVVAIFKRQTDSEQDSNVTIERNYVGFNGVDAEIMSSFARWIIAGRRLTPKQLALAQKKIRKYAGQLVSIANGSQAATAVSTVHANNEYSLDQFNVHGSILTAEASELQFVPEYFIRVGGMLFELTDTMRNDDEDLTGWYYTAHDPASKYLVIKIFND